MKEVVITHNNIFIESKLFDLIKLYKVYLYLNQNIFVIKNCLRKFS